MRQFAGDPPIEERVGRALDERGQTVAVAETCTGGLVGTLLTAVPGASDYFDRAFVPYSYDSLREELGIARETLDAEGVVSAPVTRQLARRARDRADATWGLATTGVAGPGGGTEGKPVGTAYVGVAYAGPWETETSYAIAERHAFDGDRGQVREQVSRAALERLREGIEKRG
ncbi:MAG: CinA family protein [Halobacteriales archaeon]